MVHITDQQVDRILQDLEAQGILLEDLRLNLLDHICCVLENELTCAEEFDAHYPEVLQRFYRSRLSEIQEETELLLTFKHYYAMKKTMIYSGAFSATILTFGIWFKFMHWPGASVLVTLGIGIFSLLFLPLLFTMKMKEKTGAAEKVLMLLGLAISILLSLGTLFRIMHWPMAMIMGGTAVALLGLVYLPLNFITGIKKPESKLSTITTSIVILAGCGILMSLVRSPQGSHRLDISITQHLQRAEWLLQSHRAAKAPALPEHATLAAKCEALYQECESMKSTLVRYESGVSELTATYDPDTATIGQDNLKYVLHDNPAFDKSWATLNDHITVLNNEQKSNTAWITLPNNQTEDNNFQYVSDGISSLQQIQEFILSNENHLAH